MRGAVLVLVVLASVEATAAEPFAGDAVYGTEDGCRWLETRTFPGTEGTMVVTHDFVRFYESMCHFVDRRPGVHEDLFVSAICYGECEIWPATYAMAIDPNTGALVMSSASGGGWRDLGVCPGATGALADEILGE